MKTFYLLLSTLRKQIILFQIKAFRRLNGLGCLLLVFLLLSNQGQAQRITHLGLIAELTELNRQCSHMGMMILNDSNLNAKVKIDFSHDYFLAKTYSDQILFQLISDITASESIKLFQKIDQLLVEKTIDQIAESDLQDKGRNYIRALKLYHQACDKLSTYEDFAQIAQEVAVVTNQANFALSKMSVEQQSESWLSLSEDSLMELINQSGSKHGKLISLLSNLRLEPMANLMN